MSLGLNDHTFLSSDKTYRTLDAIGIIEEVHRLGLGGIHFSTLWSFENFSNEYLNKIKQRSEKYNLYIEVGIGACNPYSDCRIERDKDRDPRETLKEIIPIAAKLGSPIVRTFLGGHIKERLSNDPPLEEQIKETIKVLQDVEEVLKDYQVKIAMENHLVLTSQELKELVEKAGPEYVGVCFDTGNPLLLLEDPVEVLENLLPYICSTHLKDGIICSAEIGAVWRSVPFGKGSVDLKSIIKRIYEVHPEVNLSLEDLWDVFPVPIFNEIFVNSLKHLTPAGMVKVIRWLRKGDAMLARKGILPMEDLEREKRGKIIRERIPENITWEVNYEGYQEG